MGDGLRKTIVDKVTADALKDAAENNLSNKEFTNLLTNKVKNWTADFKKGGMNFVEKWLDNTGTFSKMTLANYGVKVAANAAQGEDITDTSAGGLIQDLGEAALKQAPILGGLGVLAETKLAPHTEIKEGITKDIFDNPSRENIDNIKKQLYDIGFSEGHNWTPQQMDATFKHIDRIAEIAKTLPKNINQKDITKAIDIVQDRNELQKDLQQFNDQRETIDPALKDIASSHENYLNDKIDQANDKLRTLVTGKETTYSNPQEGKYFKITDGKKEPITESRYKLENLEQQHDESTKIPSAQEEVEGNGKQVEQRPGDATKEQETANAEKNDKGNVKQGGEEPPLIEPKPKPIDDAKKNKELADAYRVEPKVLDFVKTSDLKSFDPVERKNILDQQKNVLNKYKKLVELTKCL